MPWNERGGGGEPGGVRYDQEPGEEGWHRRSGNLSGPLPLSLGLCWCLGRPLGDGLEVWTETYGRRSGSRARRRSWLCRILRCRLCLACPLNRLT